MSVDLSGVRMKLRNWILLFYCHSVVSGLFFIGVCFYWFCFFRLCIFDGYVCFLFCFIPLAWRTEQLRVWNGFGYDVYSLGGRDPRRRGGAADSTKKEKE